MKRPRKALPRFERLAMIGRLLFFASYDAGARVWMSPTQIAHELGMSPSKHLRGMLEEMADNGQLDMVRQDYVGCVSTRTLYTANTPELKRVFEKVITIRSRGIAQW